MKIDGVELSKEEIKHAELLSRTLLSVVTCFEGDEDRAINAGLGCFIELAYMRIGAEQLIPHVHRLLDLIIEARATHENLDAVPRDEELQ